MIDWKNFRAGVDPSFANDVDSVLVRSPYSYVVTFGYRSTSEQTVLYNAYKATGKNRAAAPGNSAHEYRLAIDVAVDSDPSKPGLQPDWNTKAAAWVWLTAEVNKHPRLNTLWYLADFGHIQAKDWRARAGVSSASPSPEVVSGAIKVGTVLLAFLFILAAAQKGN